MGPVLRLLTVDGHWRVRPEPARPGRARDWARRLDIEAGLVIETPGRRLRLFAVYGEAPGSRMIGKHAAAWRTRIGDLRGVNVRVGWWPGPCLTALAHTRRGRR